MLHSMVDEDSIHGWYKSHFSTMKKLLKDGRKPQEVYDVLGLWVVLKPKASKDEQERGTKSYYRTHEIIQSLWKEVPQRIKDYIAKPKDNGYESLPLVMDLSDYLITPHEDPNLTIQMDAMAIGGSISHALCKGGLTDAELVEQLKAIIMVALNIIPLHL
eukprot:Gb_35315 [translate_table: standard]